MANKPLFSIGSALDHDSAWQFEEDQTSSKPLEIKLPTKHFLVLKMEKRQGKPVSIVGPFFLEKEALIKLCSFVKKKLGSGGTCKEEWMEFQGECREKLKTILMAEEFRFKG
jgi:translation initiation factor 1